MAAAENLMKPNSTNMCMKCLRSEVDITEDLQKHVTIMFCLDCECYLQSPHTWVNAQPGSSELLKLSVKLLLENLNEVTLTGSRFIWTEAHSRTIIVELCIQRTVSNGMIFQQRHKVEYEVQDHICETSAIMVQANAN